MNYIMEICKSKGKNLAKLRICLYSKYITENSITKLGGFVLAGRERLGSRIGFIMIAAGCSIGCGNVWKFPWMCGQNGGGSFIFIYILCLLLLGLPSMTMEFSIGRAAQKSPLRMLKTLRPDKKIWGIPGYFFLAGNIALMAFYTVVAGWILCYFCKYASWSFSSLFQTSSNALPEHIQNLGFVSMITDSKQNVIYLLAIVIITFGILCFDLHNGLERVTKVMMVALLALMAVLAIRSLTLSGAKEGIKFYLIPDFSKINGGVIVSAMNQAFFTLSVGMGSMAIFGSYIDKDYSLMGESITVIVLDTIVAIMAGIIIFPACFTFNLEVGAGPSLLFDTMVSVFNNMNGGQWWGTIFFLFMVFAALSTVLAVCENIIAMFRELTGLSRPIASIICGIIVFALSLTTALGYSVLHFQPFAEGSTWLDFWDFIISNNILPLGSLVLALFCCYKFGWNWDNFVAEANHGKGIKVKKWMKPLFKYFVPIAIIFIYIYGLFTFPWK